MSEYTFENFDDYEFEILCRDLLNEEQRLVILSNHGLIEYKNILTFSSYKRGKDGGVDLYYEDKINEVKVIGQVKLLRDKFPALLSSLKKKVNGKNEIDKVQSLKPKKYIFMTSVPLSLKNKETLEELFAPYIIKIEDIYGKEDINKLISYFPKVEERHVKLYFNSPLVIKRLLDSATLSRSEYTVNEFRSQIDYFVQTTSFVKAHRILKEHNLIIIKGQPGVGKTTLAKILSLYFLEKGYQFIDVLDLDNEIERLLESKEKCVFYYDDFLGSNSLLISDAIRNEPRLSKLIRRIFQSSNKALILTTRTNILKNAEYNSDKLRKAFSIISKYEVELSLLNEYEKKEILDKHIKRNNLELNPLLFSDSLKQRIVNHKNFSPRLIEFITEKIRVLNNESNYDSFAIECLDNPEEIWQHAYLNQIYRTDRIYLNHLFLFGNWCDVDIFRESFSNRLKHEAKINNYTINHLEFKESTLKLDETFIKISNNFYSEKTIEFINPSFVDFLINEVKGNYEQIKDSIIAFDRAEIITNRFNHAKKSFSIFLNLRNFVKYY